MTDKIKKISPTENLGDFLIRICKDYEAIGLGVFLHDTEEAAMLMENSQVKSGILEKSNYSLDGATIGLPQVKRHSPVICNLNYILYLIKLSIEEIDELFKDKAIKLLEKLDGANLLDFYCVAYRNDEGMYLLVNKADTSGKPFSSENEAALIKIFD